MQIQYTNRSICFPGLIYCDQTWLLFLGVQMRLAVFILLTARALIKFLDLESGWIFEVGTSGKTLISTFLRLFGWKGPERGWALIWVLVWGGGRWGGGGHLFEAGCLLNFSAFRMGAYSRRALIQGWALIWINTVTWCKICFTLGLSNYFFSKIT